MQTKALSKIIGTNLCAIFCNHVRTFSAKESFVLSFGDGSHGALGLPAVLTGHAADAYEPTPIPGLPPDIVSLSAGHYHSLAVSSDGHLWSWGRDLESQLGRGKTSRDTWNEPKRVQFPNHVKLTSASASGVVSSAIDSNGSVWVWGTSKRGQLGLGEGVITALSPSRIEALAGEAIKKVSFGWGHALAVSVTGKLFGWGYSANGRIGGIGGRVVSNLESVHRRSSDEEIAIVWSPFPVEEFDGIEVEEIACGLDHSLILCGNGSIYSSGSNIYGQLGREGGEIGMFPVERGRVKGRSVAAGLGHSLAIIGDEKRGGFSVVSWGWNERGQLGRGGAEGAVLEVEAIAGERAVIVAGGRVHSMAVTSEQELLVWGCGKNGRLGLGSSIDEPEPVLVDSLGCYRVLQAVAGFDHNMLLVSERQC